MSENVLELESEIVWLREDLHLMPYIREAFLSTTRPYSKPPKSNKEKVIVGYAMLKPGLKSTRGASYLIRHFYLKPQDRYFDPNGTYKTDYPSDAVDPMSIQVGVPSLKNFKS